MSSKSKKGSTQPQKERPGKQKKSFHRPALIALSVLGLLLSLYLSYLHFTETQAAFCGEGSDCDVVRQSGFSSILGIPVAFLGALGYAVILALIFSSVSVKRKWLLLYIVSIAGVTFSAYLTYLELFVIDAICKYCVISALFMVAIFIVLLIAKDQFYPKFSGAKTAVLGVCVFALVFTTAYSIQYEEIAQAKLPHYEITPADSFTVSLAKYMGSRGAVMFGSYKCPHCNDQKKMFGSAFEYIKYVECHPQGPDANPSLCLARGVQNFPTWEINGRYYQGAMSLERLSALSGFESTGQQ